MTKRYCDKCGAEMEHAHWTLQIDNFPLTPKRIDLCVVCSAAISTVISDWMEGGFWQ